MKNFKLLLGATAIMSIGAFVANADPTIAPGALGSFDDASLRGTATSGSNITITPSVDIITPLEVTNTDMYFGTLISPKKDDTVVITNYIGDAEGTATLVDRSIGNSTQAPSAGSIEATVGGNMVGSQSLGFTFPTSIDLKNGDTKCGTVTNIGLVTNHGTGFSYGGTFTVASDGLSAGKCQGNGTVTVIVDDLNRSYPMATGGSN